MRRAIRFGMMRIPVFCVSTLALCTGTAMFSACAGSRPPAPATSPSASATTREVTRQKAATSATSASHTPDAQDADDDHQEAGDPATLEPVVARGDRMPVARAKVKEKDCWRAVALTGDARQDYASLVEQCGKPTGAIE